MLEGWAAERCAENATDKDLAELSGLVEQLAATEQRGNIKQMLDVLDACHEPEQLSANGEIKSSLLGI